MLFIYFYLISFSLIGYGLFTCKILNINLYKFGSLGILGISFLTILSFFSSLFIKHDYLFNLSTIILGIFFFLFFFRKIKNIKKEFYNYFLIFSILAIFIIVGKNHDDFPYYHFPYTSILTEYSHPIGLGQLNNGFRNPSSIFFISSMFYLPKASYYLFHITPAFILGFANLLLIEKIFDRNIFKKDKFINLLCLISFIFLNIFFYRLAEHGTDRSGMILIIICIILLFYIINNSSNIFINENKDNIKLFSISLCLLVTLKPFYLIYIPLLVIFFFHKHTKEIIKELILSKIFLFCFLLIFFSTFYTFINSGCIIYPATFTCFEKLPWSLPIELIEGVRIWFELWAKGGATPNFVVDDQVNYINNFNWFTNWIEVYFFNKVSDFILGLLILTLIFFITFYSKKFKKYPSNNNTFIVYIFLLICFIEWFLYHPALRYGGYHLIALIIFIPLCLFLSRINFDSKVFFRKASFLILITIVIFLGRNIARINKEYNNYKYNPFINTNYKFIGGDEKFYLRYNEHMKNNIFKYPKVNFLGKSFIITKLKK